LFAPEPDISVNISKNTLYDKFKKLVDDQIPASGISLEEYTSRMAEDTLLYLNIINAEVSKFDSSSNERINELLEGLGRLGYTQERIYLMGLLLHSENASDVIRGIKLIESFIIRQRFTNYITGSSLNELYAEICRDAFTRDDPVSYIRSRLKSQAPRDDELIVAIAGNDFPRSKRTLFVLESIEARHFRRENRSRVSTGEIEHIVPRKAFTAKKYNKWPDYLNCGKGEFNEYKDKIGNLTILEKRLNLEASDQPFGQKKNKYRSSNYEMAQSIDGYNDWSTGSIEERTQEMAEIVADVWNFEF
jgi:hypothetical protein